MKQPEPSTTPEGSPHSDSGAVPASPPRSRNAKAQARHRAKRKAYILQLEQTVARLQSAVGGAGDPGSAGRLHELEQENLRLRTENELLKTQLGFVDQRRPPPVHVYASSLADGPTGPRDLKRRRTSADGAGDPNPYLGPPAAASSAPSPTAPSSQDQPQQQSHLPPSVYRQVHGHPSQAGSAGPSSSSSSAAASGSAAQAPYPPLTHGAHAQAGNPAPLSLSPLPELATVPRRHYESYPDRSESIHATTSLLPPASAQQQQQSPQQLQFSSATALAPYDRRPPDTPGFVDNPFGHVDLDTWRGYTSFARGT